MGTHDDHEALAVPTTVRAQRRPKSFVIELSDDDAERFRDAIRYVEARTIGPTPSVLTHIEAALEEAGGRSLVWRALSACVFIVAGLSAVPIGIHGGLTREPAFLFFFCAFCGLGAIANGLRIARGLLRERDTR